MSFCSEIADTSPFLEDPYGTADAAIEGDDLDDTMSKVPSPETVAEAGAKEAVSTGSPQGLSLSRKLFFLGGIIGVVALFLRTRKPQSDIVKEKSLV